MAKIRVLIVDDNPAFLRSVSQLISSYKEFELAGAASSAAGALEQVSLLQPDLVLMDLVMPDMSGIETTRLVKAKPGAPKVVVCTLYGDPHYEQAAMAAGADGFLPKSRLSKQLLQVVRTLFSPDESSLDAP